MTLLPILLAVLAAVYLGTGNCYSKIVQGSFFPPIAASMFVNLSEICKSVIEIFWDDIFMVRNTVKNGQS